MIDVFVAIRLVQIVAAAGLVLSSAELLSLYPEFKGGGVLNCSLSRSYRLSSGSLVSRLLAPLIVRAPVVATLISVRLWAGLFLLFLYPGTLLAIVTLSIAFFACLATNYAMAFGKDGSDQMLLVVFGGLLTAEIGLFRDHAWLAQISLWFIGLQCVLAYFTAGIAKLFGETWRSGHALHEVLSTQTYGNQMADKFFPTEKSAKFFNWLVVGFESAFPMVLLLDAPWSFVVLASAATFHLSVAYVMGLNTFLWAFGAAYPAVAYCADQI